MIFFSYFKSCYQNHTQDQRPEQGGDAASHQGQRPPVPPSKSRITIPPSKSRIAIPPSKSGFRSNNSS